MPEVIFPGPEGRLEGRFNPGPRPRAPVAMILHPHPQGGGTMNNAIVLVDLINQESWVLLGTDVKGDIYEGLLEKNAELLRALELLALETLRLPSHARGAPASAPALAGGALLR